MLIHQSDTTQFDLLKQVSTLLSNLIKMNHLFKSKIIRDFIIYSEFFSFKIIEILENKQKFTLSKHTFELVNYCNKPKYQML